MNDGGPKTSGPMPRHPVLEHLGDERLLQPLIAAFIVLSILMP